MSNSKKATTKTSKTIEFQFSFTEGMEYEVLMVLLDLRIINSDKKIRDFIKQLPKDFKEKKFWQLYNDPKRIRFPEKKLDEYIKEGIVQIFV